MYSEITAKIEQLTKQGAGELAHALFNGSAYLPYGEGQKSIEPEKQPDGPEQEQQQERDGMSR
jgi:hypothetical protein